MFRSNNYNTVCNKWRWWSSQERNAVLQACDWSVVINPAFSLAESYVHSWYSCVVLWQLESTNLHLDSNNWIHLHKLAPYLCWNLGENKIERNNKSSVGEVLWGLNNLGSNKILSHTFLHSLILDWLHSGTWSCDHLPPQVLFKTTRCRLK